LMAIIGGLSSVVGPVIGAIIYLLLEQFLSAATAHWPLIMGVILVLIVLFAREGVMGGLVAFRRNVRNV